MIWIYYYLQIQKYLNFATKTLTFGFSHTKFDCITA